MQTLDQLAARDLIRYSEVSEFEIRRLLGGRRIAQMIHLPPVSIFKIQSLDCFERWMDGCLNLQVPRGRTFGTKVLTVGMTSWSPLQTNTNICLDL